MGVGKNNNKKMLFLAASAAIFSVLFIKNPVIADDSDINLLQDPNTEQTQQYSDEGDVYYKRGLEFLNSNQFTKAIDLLERSLGLSPNRQETRINLAVAYINRGTYFYRDLKDDYKSLNDYRNAIFLLKYDSIVPSSVIATENLGIAKEDLNNVLKNAQISTDKASRLKIAKELRGEGKFREALVEYMESLQGNNNDLAVYIAAGDMCSILQNDKSAVKYYKKAVAINTNNSNLHLKLAKSLHNTGDVENALKEYNVALNNTKEENKAEVLKTLETIWVKKLQENPQDATAHMNLGVILQKEGDYEGALKEYQFAEAINPNDITTRLNIGTLYQANKDYATAISAYNSILQIKPDDLLAHYYLGTAYKDAGQVDSAIKEFQSVLNADPNNVKAKEALFETIKMNPDNQEVASIFKTLADNNPADAFAQFKYALHLHSSSRLDEAISYYKKTIAIDPKFVEAYLNIANIYKQQKLASNAVITLENGLKALPKNQKLTDLLNSIKSESATFRYQTALKKHKECKYDEAIKEYLYVIQVSQPDSDLYVNLGAAYQASKKLNEAANAYKKASEINSKNSTAFYYLGTVYSAQSKNEEALKSYEKALSLDTSNEDIKQALIETKQEIKDSALQKGINEYNKAKYNEALLTFNALSMKDSQNGFIYYYRGMVYDALKKYQLAIADYKLAVRYKPDLAYAYYATAVDYDSLKNYPEAKRWYKVFVEKSTDKSDQYVKYATVRIKQIK